MSDDRWSPLMLRSEHDRILGSAQERYDQNMDELYARGKWDGFAMGALVGFMFGLVAMIGIIGFAEGWIR